MTLASEQLDRRFAAIASLEPLARRPKGGWVRALREALGMTTAQLAKRMGVSQPRISELEGAEATGNVTIRSLERAAEALGCRLVYVLVPSRPLEDRIREQAEKVASHRLAHVEQTMRLEDQACGEERSRKELERQLVADLIKNPARLWSHDG